MDFCCLTFEICIFLFVVKRRNGFCVLLCVYALLCLVPTVLADRTAFVDVQKVDSNGRASADVILQTKGVFAPVGAVRRAEGIVHQLPADECGDEDDGALLRARPKEWVAMLNYPFRDHSNQTYAANGTNCNTVLDRVKRALMFGASAIIILVLNPKVVKELEMSQIFSKPIIVLQSAENVSAVLTVLLSTIRVKVTYNASSYDLQKVSMWSLCGRVSPGLGIVCTAEHSKEQAEPEHLWHYIFSFLALLMLLLVIKSAGRDTGDDFEHIEHSLRRIACQALVSMKTKRYRQCPPETDTCCAVCLEEFRPRQRVRVLPCQHEFHKDCVDPWLIKQRTCPLCKRNIIESISCSSSTTASDE